MKLGRYGVIVTGIVVVFFIAALVFYPQMPEQMASHWNAAGDVDGYMSRFWGIMLLPLVAVGLAALFALIPRIDPFRVNIEKFKGYYYGFVTAILVFMLYVYVLTLLWSLGLRFDMGQVLMPAMGILFFAAGVLMGKAKRNFFIGIRTPWTLSSDEVWERTHRLGAALFKVAGLLVVGGVFFPDYMMWIIMGTILPAAFIPIVYSYFVWRQVSSR